MSSKVLTAAAAVIAVLAGLAAASIWLNPPSVTLKSGTLLKQPRELPAFTLQGSDGQPFTNASLRGHWTLVFPGFTHCPDVCPTTLAYLKNLVNGLAKDGVTAPRVLFLSVDPARDTPARIAEYVHYFDPAFIGATAAEPALGDFAKALSIVYIKQPGKTEDTYTMDHSAALVLINPDARVAAFFTPPFQLDPMSADLKAVLGARP